MNRETLLTLNGEGQHVDQRTLFDVERWLYREARQLNNEQLREWYDNLSEDIAYWAPIRENRFRRNTKKTPEITLDRCALFDETKETIDIRLGRIESGMCWTEDPPIRQVYAITNVEAFHTEKDDELEVHSIFTLYRSRFERDDSTLMGRRKDILRKVDGKFQLAGRMILLQQSTLLAKNLSSFF